jgi:hypothetical protein
MVGGGFQGLRERVNCLTGAEFHFGKMKKFWRKDWKTDHTSNRSSGRRKRRTIKEKIKG